MAGKVGKKGDTALVGCTMDAGAREKVRTALSKVRAAKVLPDGLPFPDSSLHLSCSAPELLLGFGCPTPEADVWAAACVIFSVYTGSCFYQRSIAPPCACCCSQNFVCHHACASHHV
ncbi:hypothetical protein EON66_09765 [archaeon]|nr:MAG: hypothetical protein EON66_09765 [archaeon]